VSLKRPEKGIKPKIYVNRKIAETDQLGIAADFSYMQGHVHNRTSITITDIASSGDRMPGDRLGLRADASCTVKVLGI
jgi:hypothetical protein